MARKNDYAIVVGIEDYVTLRRLNGPLNDAKNFVTWLIDSSGGDVPKENCFYIPSTANPVKPLQDDIDESFLRLYEAGANKEFERFYFFFAGHGFGRDWRDTGLCLPKWSESRRNYALSSSLYLDVIVKSGFFREIYFFLDCCRDKMFSIQPLPPTFGWAEAPTQAQSLVAYAAEFDNPAYEAMRIDNNGASIQGNFTKALMQGLKGAAGNENGDVTVHSLKGYLKKTVEELARLESKYQSVRFEDTFTDNAIITKGAGPLTFPVRIDLSAAGTYQIEDSQLNIIKNGDQNTGPWNLQLKKGVYSLRNLTTSKELFIRVDGTKSKFAI